MTRGQDRYRSCPVCGWPPRLRARKWSYLVSKRKTLNNNLFLHRPPFQVESSFCEHIARTSRNETNVYQRIKGPYWARGHAERVAVQHAFERQARVFAAARWQRHCSMRRVQGK